MMTKNELIELLEAAIDFEERAAPALYDKGMACLRQIQSLEILDMDRRKIRRLLFEIMADAKEHQKQLQVLLEHVRKGPQNEY